MVITMKMIGVLAMQGAVEEHLAMLSRLPNVKAKAIKNAKQLHAVDGIILPGGESTTISKLMNEFGIMAPLKEQIQQGLPVWGTCAGMILLAKNIVGENTNHLGVMDIHVRRNAYGSQLDSFVSNQVVLEICDAPLRLVFIRAPWVEKVGGGVEVLATIDNQIVAARQKNMMVTSFHPELTGDTKVHEYFVQSI
jgi:5'-phosphate synthase pdxT subunit